MREALQERGLVGENKLRVDNGQREIGLAVGERVMMTKNEYQLDVRNGQRGMVRAIDEKSRILNVRMDNGQDKQIDLDKYHSIDYGYASTTHKAQGMTMEEMEKTWGRDAMKDTTLDYERARQWLEQQRLQEQQRLMEEQQWKQKKGREGVERDIDF